MGVGVQGLGLRFACRGVDNDEQIMGGTQKAEISLSEGIYLK